MSHGLIDQPTMSIIYQSQLVLWVENSVEIQFD